MSDHTQGRVTFREDGDACHWSMLTEDGRWWLAVLANGEQASERQIANFRRIAACWNACEGIDTVLLESLRFPIRDISSVPMLVEDRDAIKAQRDALLAACKKMAEWEAREKDHAISFSERLTLCDEAFSLMRAAIEAAEKGGAT